MGGVGGHFIFGALHRTLPLEWRYFCPPAKADTIKSTDIAAYRDERLQALAGNTVKNELNLLSAVFKHAELEWVMRIKNPVKGLKRPPDGARSVRILDLKAVESLRAEAMANKREDLSALIMLATQTGARLGELLSIQRFDIDLELGFIHLRTSKNGEPRVLPLTPACSEAAIALLSAEASPWLFPRPADHYKYAFCRLTTKFGVEWATFHSLRHLAVTRMLESGLSVTETSAISGHKTVHMLKRYAHHSHSHLRRQVLDRLG
jgi:integrase